jgi:hypothetical protein
VVPKNHSISCRSGVAFRGAIEVEFDERRGWGAPRRGARDVEEGRGWEGKGGEGKRLPMLEDGKFRGIAALLVLRPMLQRDGFQDMGTTVVPAGFPRL